MSKNAPAASSAPTAALTVFRLAALFTFLAVAMGAVVCATKSGASCPTWPGCRASRLTPQWQLSPVIEFTHRVVAFTAGPLLLAAAALSTRLPRPDRWLRTLPWVALVGALASGFFGRLVIVSTLPTALGGVDLFCALTAMTVMGIAAVRAGTPGPEPTETAGPEPAAATERRPVQTSRLAAASVTALVTMHVCGIFTAGTGSYTGCVGWPLWRLIDGDLHPWLQGLRLGLAGLGALLVLTTAAVAARSERLRPWGTTLVTLFVAEMVMGQVISARGLNNGVAAAYSVVAAALLWCLGLLSAVAWSARIPVEQAPADPFPAQAELAGPGRL
jgi:cytochrome c oxidase assembly protein subunit 15